MRGPPPGPPPPPPPAPPPQARCLSGARLTRASGASAANDALRRDRASARAECRRREGAAGTVERWVRGKPLSTPPAGAARPEQVIRSLPRTVGWTLLRLSSVLRSRGSLRACGLGVTGFFASTYRWTAVGGPRLCRCCGTECPCALGFASESGGIMLKSRPCWLHALWHVICIASWCPAGQKASDDARAMAGQAFEGHGEIG